ncbi:hypothetical protein DUNSADRAFT_2940 [Dunaliella salina]|uniref:BZIP domain-containing protein n=1 Tax=Dunaliella salina TaxID=3046 RepID=A0ABQ7GUV8_DUNSA|nr:hypothetical protein DUNSADRAFT_2940 [Dunaliella salina]|eukprot:KAF5838404.1 hypothetical protein DUNSADRAFT_2940 [Dunaliella salina]
MDSDWQLDPLHQGMDDPLDAFLFEPPALPDFHFAEMASCFPDVKQQQLIDELANEPKPQSAPEVDWKAIQDPEERRRQRRLAKNRLTAARSRERKKAILSELEAKLQGFEVENARLQEMLAAMGEENKDLKQQLGQLCNPGSASVAAAAAAAAAADGAPGRADADRSTKGTRNSNLPATSVKVLLALLLCMCLCKLTGEQLGLVLGGALPLLALAQLIETEGGLRTVGVSHGGRTKRRRTSNGRASSRSTIDAAHNTPSRNSAMAKHHNQQDNLSQVFAGLAHFLAAFGQAAPQLCQGLQYMLHSRAACIPKGMFGPGNSSGGRTSSDGSSMEQKEECGSGSEVGRVVAQGLPVKPSCRARSRQGPAGLLF